MKTVEAERKFFIQVMENKKYLLPFCKNISCGVDCPFYHTPGNFLDISLQCTGICVSSILQENIMKYLVKKFPLELIKDR